MIGGVRICDGERHPFYGHHPVVTVSGEPVFCYLDGPHYHPFEAPSIPDYKTLNRQLIDDVAYVPLFYPVAPFLFKPYVLGAGSNNMFDYWWDQIQLISH